MHPYKKSNWPTESRHKRGYGYAWEKTRRLVLARDYGLCQCEQCKGGRLKVTLATEVHHIKPRAEGGTDALSNLQAIAKDCHKRETAAQQNRILKPKLKIGPDGFPI
jgi:5-methylcytosine-specific restriction protein A